MARSVYSVLKNKSVLISNTPANPVPTTGTFIPSGFTAGAKLTKVTLNSTQWTPLPATSLTVGTTSRNTVGVQNKTGVTVYIAWYDGGVPTIPAADGWELENNAEFFSSTLDIIEGTLYGRVASGTATVKVMEIA